MHRLIHRYEDEHMQLPVRRQNQPSLFTQAATTKVPTLLPFLRYFPPLRHPLNVITPEMRRVQ